MGALNTSNSSGVELVLPGPCLCGPKRLTRAGPNHAWNLVTPWPVAAVTAVQSPAAHLSTMLRPSMNSTLWNFLPLARPRALVGLLVLL